MTDVRITSGCISCWGDCQPRFGCLKTCRRCWCGRPDFFNFVVEVGACIVEFPRMTRRTHMNPMTEYGAPQVRFFFSYHSWLSVSLTTNPESLTGPKSCELLTYLVVWHAQRVLCCLLTYLLTYWHTDLITYLLLSGTCPKPMFLYTLVMSSLLKKKHFGSV